MDINTIKDALFVMLGVAGFFGVVLALANRYLKVHEDERIGHVEDMLPGSNCGACGQPGCHAFAESLVAGSTTPGKCTVSPANMTEKIAQYLGVNAGFEQKRVARLHCAGGKSSVRELAQYQGFQSCRAAVTVNRGGRSCNWGCLGLADCERACTFGAISMNPEGLPVVNVDLCTACNDCVEVCPLNLFTLEPLANKVIVQCNSPLRGDTARDACLVACDACGRCALDAPKDVIEMVNGLPVIRIPTEADIQCTFRCPTGAIQWVDGDQFQDIKKRSKYA